MNRQKLDSLQKIHDSTHVWENILDKIEHIAVNKLAIIRSINRSTQEALPVLLKAYQVAFEHKLIKDELNFENEKQNLAPENTDMEPIIGSVFQLFDAIYSFRKKLVDKNKSYKTLSASGVIENVLKCYNFKYGDQNLVSFNNKDDFNISFPELFLTSIIQETLDFIFDSPNKSDERKIEIYFSKKKEMNSIHIKMSLHEAINYVDRFFNNSLTIKDQIIRPGMNFCRLALLNAGGDITYHTEVNYLEIVILTPNPEDNI